MPKKVSDLILEANNKGVAEIAAQALDEYIDRFSQGATAQELFDTLAEIMSETNLAELKAQLEDWVKS